MKTKKDKMMESLNNYFKNKVDESSESLYGEFFRQLENIQTLSLEKIKKLVEKELILLRK